MSITGVVLAVAVLAAADNTVLVQDFFAGRVNPGPGDNWRVNQAAFTWRPDEVRCEATDIAAFPTGMLACNASGYRFGVSTLKLESPPLQSFPNRVKTDSNVQKDGADWVCPVQNYFGAHN